MPILNGKHDHDNDEKDLEYEHRYHIPAKRVQDVQEERDKQKQGDDRPAPRDRRDDPEDNW